MKYELVLGNLSEINLYVQTINEQIGKGWRPLGGPFIYGLDRDFFGQAMIFETAMERVIHEDGTEEWLERPI